MMSRAETNRQLSSSRSREVSGIVLLGLALFVGLSVASLQLGAGTLMGPAGATVGLGVYALFGVGAYLFAIGLALCAVRCLVGRAVGWKSVETWAAIGVGLSAAILLHLALGRFRLRGYSPGGLVGEYGAELLIALVGRVGAALFGTMGLFVALVLSTSISFRAIGRVAWRGLRAAGAMIARSVIAIFPERDQDDDDAADDEAERGPRRVKSDDNTVTDRALDVEERDVVEDTPLPPRRRKRRDDEAQVVKLPPAPAVAAAAEDGAPAAIIDNEKTELSDAPPLEEPKIVEVKPLAPKIVEPKPIAKKADPAAPKQDYIPAAGGYHLPDLVLLDDQGGDDDKVDRAGRDEMLALADKLQKTLSDYSVKGSVVEIHPGPVVTMYEFVPAPGTKLSRITGLANDLAMALAALRVRIVAPIPGKASVGIEVPNKKRATVYLKEILADGEVQKAKSRLTMGLGKDISGQPVAVDLAKMPHLLVAGTTGSGKSVAVNGMICSILFNATPDEVRMIMIDPKMVELSIYEGIPHLLLPVVTDPKKANLALKWAVDEMERRYELVSKAGVRDILAYNKKVDAKASAADSSDKKKLKVYVTDEHGNKQETELESAAAGPQLGLVAQAPPPEKKLPYIVVIIDEFADLMMVAPKDVETSVARIAQKARAVGIHLLLATQRPSVDVITGLIKANFPSRMAFQVASKIDSRTILDQQGAENLLGMGDMLFTDRGQALRRIHGALVTDVEIKGLVEFLKKQGQPVYDMDILKPREDDAAAEGGLPADEGDDPCYDMAVRIVTETRNASVSMLQRRLQIGFNRASRLVERMEREGLVGAANGSKPREVLAGAM
jgi:DNA segregation ATPase FtsK/SpoIIIE, S-DNA-T family